MSWESYISYGVLGNHFIDGAKLYLVWDRWRMAASRVGRGGGGGFFHILIFCTTLEKMLWTNQFYGMFYCWLYSQVCGTAIKICLLCGLLGALQSIIGIWDFRSVSLFRSGTHILIFCWYNPFSLVVNGNLATVYKYFFHDWTFFF